MLAKTIIILTVIGLSTAATWYGEAYPKPKELAHKEGCYVKEMNDVIPDGSTATPIGECIRVECSGNMLYYASCGLVMAGPGCHVTDQDLTKPYPACCKQVKCDKDNRV